MVYRSALQLSAATCTWISSCYPLLRFLQIMSASGPWESKSVTHTIFSLIWFRETWKTGAMDPTCTILITSTGLYSWCKKVGPFPLRWKFSPDETLLILHREGLLNRILFWGDSISSLPFSCRNRPLNFRFMDRKDYNFYFDSLRSKSLSFEKIISFFPHVKYFLFCLLCSFQVWS